MKLSPAQLLPGYTFEAGQIRIPIASLSGLTAAAADPNTGNAMEILRQLVEHTNDQIGHLAPAARPTKATIVKQNLSISTTPGTLRQNYSISFDLQPTALELAQEPSI